ncbi:MAG: alanine--tRNA ligase [Candidatus Pacearchaeota archaeon]
MITRKDLIKKYLDFFKEKGHKEVQNASLVPENDPSVLFTTAGMHPLVPFLLGEKHPSGKRICNVQRCVRTGDIDSVGDSYHHTFFEMLGNWSLNDYWKEEAIKMTFEFHTKILKIPLERYAVSVFNGDEIAPRDEETIKIWKKLGIKEERIALLGRSDNWWETAGAGPCGPCTEQFFYKGKNPPEVFNPEDKNWVEIGNDVLMEYVKDKEGNYKKSSLKNIDFGGGVERTLAVLNGLEDNYLTDCFLPIIRKIEELSGKEYGKNEEETRAMRIIADHLKASVFILGDGVLPSNVERGYVLRRLIRRAIRFGRSLGIKEFTKKVALAVFDIYDDYGILNKNKIFILDELEKEEKRFLETLEKGIKEFEKITEKSKEISGKDSFLLYQSFGFPLELTKELAKEKGISVDEKTFYEELKKHQELSRSLSAGVFKSGLADDSEKTKKLHTATHLLNEALRVVLNDRNICQKGSNITPERLRFDFNFPRKLTSEELKKVEDLVNKKIQEGLKVDFKEMSVEEAKKIGAQGVFESKYGDKVKVYFIGDFSKEICAGPHVSNTKELGKFKIIKEESSSAGVRRIKAVLE